MLFNSPQFIFGFLPIALIGFFLLGRLGWRRAAIQWLGFVSLFFYGLDHPALQLPLILTSIVFNFAVGRRLARAKSRSLLAAGVACNLLLLGFFKYAGLLASTLSIITGWAVADPAIPLPIGISFYTFTQIAFLVDVYRSEAREYRLAEYGLFVTFFPHLIAGPILHHKETVPQFDRKEIYHPQPDRIALGMGFFAIGLFKKVMLADSVAPFADKVFDAAKGGAVSLADAWIGTLSYTLQIYFDFSGYSDMAVGLAFLFGITFPLNFNSPYKARSLIDFWRRWHMTLSRFLRDYLYVPLGGNRRGPLRRYVNLLVTMVLGGLWHGASWNFAIWGALHGAGLALNHLWQGVAARTGIAIPTGLSWLLLLGFVIFAWVPFRADTLTTSTVVWAAMLGASEARVVIDNPLLPACWIVALGALALFAPNTQQIMSHPWIDERARIKWAPRPAWALALGCLFGVAVAGTFGRESSFLYFRF
jgi:D-alanyl-lipoteichoic acid acyltransferase DltB (MBOAT superfamily)